MLDQIFGENHFLNEIVWCYSQGGRSKDHFPRKHDTIFLYANGKSWTFNSDDIRIPYELLSEKSQTSFTKTDADGRKYKEIYGPGKKKLYRYYEDEGKVPYDWWTDIHQMTGRTAASKNEYLGYPTQKPIALLDRIIKASSKIKQHLFCNLAVPLGRVSWFPGRVGSLVSHSSLISIRTALTSRKARSRWGTAWRLGCGV